MADPDPAVMVEGQEMVGPSAILLAKPTTNPGQAPGIDLNDPHGPSPRDQPPVDLLCRRVQDIAGPVELGGHRHEADPVADLEISPDLVHRVGLPGGHHVRIDLTTSPETSVRR